MSSVDVRLCRRPAHGLVLIVLVVFMAGSEDKVNSEIDKLRRNYQRQPKASDSFHEDRPRKAAVRQRQFMAEMAGKKTSKKSDKEVNVSLPTFSWSLSVLLLC